MNIDGVLCKLDFSKDFDKLNISFLLNLLEARGFPTFWVLKIRKISYSSKVATIINGDVGDWILCKSGFR